MRPVGMQLRRQNAIAGSIVTSLENHGAGAISEEHTGRPVRPVQDLRKAFSSDHHRTLATAGGQHGVRHIERIDEPGADRLHIEGHRLMRAKLVLHLGRSRGKGVVRRAGGDDDEIKVAGYEPGTVQRLLRRMPREVRCLFSLGNDMTLRDAGALANPLVAGVDKSRQLLIRHDPFRQVASHRDHQSGGVSHCHPSVQEWCSPWLWRH